MRKEFQITFEASENLIQVHYDLDELMALGRLRQPDRK